MMMTSENANTPTDGDEAEESSTHNEQEAINAFMRHLARRLIGPDDRPTAEAEIQFELFSREERASIIDQFVDALTPTGISPAIWGRWLGGGPGPFAEGGLKPPKKLSHGKGKQITRGPKSIASCRQKVDRCRDELAAAERELEFNEALNKGLLHYSVTDHLVSLLSPVFAMGPAWTIMRSLSAHMSDQVAELSAGPFTGATREVILSAAAEIRREDTAEILRTLDLLSGVPVFEEALREAVLRVVRHFGKDADTLLQDRRRPRSEKAWRSTIHPRAQADADEVLKGLNEPK